MTNWRTSHLLALDHEFGEEAGMGGTTKLAFGMEASMWEVVASSFELAR